MSIKAIAEIHGNEAARRVLDEARVQLTDLGLDHREVFSARLRHELTRETHVVVGDHPPEPRRSAVPEPRVIHPGPDQCASHAPDRDARDVYVVPGSASHGPR